MHKYYCATEAGFWVYKSPEQWIKENPDVVGEKWGDSYVRPIEQLSDGYWRIWCSEFVYGETIKQSRGGSGLLTCTEKLLIDARNGYLLSRAIQFEKVNESALSIGNANFTDFKVWLAIGGNSCMSPSGQNYSVLEMRKTEKN